MKFWIRVAKPKGAQVLHILLSHMKRQDIWTHSLWESISVPTSREHSTINWKSTVTSELEVLTLIPTTSPSAANLPRVCWRSWSNGTRKPRLWQKAEMQSWGQQTSLSQFNWWFPNNWEHTPSFLVLKMGPQVTVSYFHLTVKPWHLKNTQSLRVDVRCQQTWSYLNCNY